MIQHPISLALVLLSLVWLLRRLEAGPRTATIFRILPLPFWCYAIPMLGTAAGWWPSASPLYGWCSAQLLPVCLGLLLLGTDALGILRLGRHAIGLMAVGSFGIVAGMVIAYRVWRAYLPPNAWQGLGALAGSWTGGSMNLLAVKEALGIADAVVAPVIVTDTIIAYGWMALLLARARSQGLASGPADGSCREPTPPSSWGSHRPPIPHCGAAGAPARVTRRPGPRSAIGALMIALFISWGAQAISQRLPTWAALTTATWTVLVVTTGVVLLSLTPVGRLGREPATEGVGTFCLLVLLTTIGARADLRAVGHAPAYLAAGATAVAIHGLVLALVGWWRKAPLGLLATVSQANVGGVVSAPLVAAAYDRGLAPIGLLLAVLGNVWGTYLGLLTAALCLVLR
ncbi:MAG: DUF819 family protein [Candidatus Omnitrophica bacterium]|nr:DUF819 family protein [Candidatus Omnitrophota bacterium]